MAKVLINSGLLQVMIVPLVNTQQSQTGGEAAAEAPVLEYWSKQQKM